MTERTVQVRARRADRLWVMTRPEALTSGTVSRKATSAGTENPRVPTRK